MKTGVLLMAHGSPDSLDQIEDYLRHILTRRPPSPEIVAEFQDRYRQIGGRSPLLDVTRAQASALQELLGLPVYVGMRHWAPFIADAVTQARREGVDRLVGVPMAPQYARVSVGKYHDELKKTGITASLVNHWHLEPPLIEYWKRRTSGREFVLFTAHSIPVEGAEPYPTQLTEMIREIASGPHAFAYQSRSPSPNPWLGPEVADVLATLKGRISVAPIGFICDHIEVLYDLDILHRKEAEALGLEWERLPMPNSDPLLVEAIASAVRRVL